MSTIQYLLQLFRQYAFKENSQNTVLCPELALELVTTLIGSVLNVADQEQVKSCQNTRKLLSYNPVFNDIQLPQDLRQSLDESI